MTSTLTHLLTDVPSWSIYLLVALVIAVESLGVPLPGEIVLVAAALLAAQQGLDLSALGVGAAAAVGAVVGDSAGYAIGRRAGMSAIAALGRRFPRHLGPAHLALAQRVFTRWGAAAVFLGRFVALLRILAGPLAGALRMPYRKFLAANLAGGLCWAGATTAAVYFLGQIAETWLNRFSWIALAAAIAAGLALTGYLRRRIHRHTHEHIPTP